MYGRGQAVRRLLFVTYFLAWTKVQHNRSNAINSTGAPQPQGRCWQEVVSSRGDDDARQKHRRNRSPELSTAFPVWSTYLMLWKQAPFVVGVCAHLIV